jgi:hypothetical protein
MSTDTDTRFPTNNTNLAAALAALHIPPKMNGPCSVVISGDSGEKIYTYFFEESGPIFCGEEHISVQIDWAWRNRAEFEARNPAHPLIPIRRALESRDWLTKVWHRELRVKFSSTPAKFSTDDTILAACIRASGIELLRLDGGKYQFQAVPKSLIRAFEQFNDDGKRENPVALMRRALVVRKELVECIRRCPTVTKYRSGDPATGQWTDCDIPEGLPEEQTQAILAAFQQIQ